MARFIPDAGLDIFLERIATADYMTVCAGSPVTYTDAFDNALAKVAMVQGSSGSYTIADDTSGRKLTTDAIAGIEIDTSGSAMAVCLVNSGSSVITYVTICGEQWIFLHGRLISQTQQRNSHLAIPREVTYGTNFKTHYPGHCCKWLDTNTALRANQ